MKNNTKKIISLLCIFTLMIGTIIMPVTSVSAAESFKISDIENAFDGLKLTWSAVKGADKYKVERKLEGAIRFLPAGTTTSTSFIDEKAVDGKKYYYRIQALKGTQRLSSSEQTSLVTSYKYPNIVDVYCASDGVHIKAGSGMMAQHVQVFRQEGNKVTPAKNTRITSRVDRESEFVDTNVKEGKTYTYVAGSSFKKYSAHTYTIKYSAIPHPAVTIPGIKNDGDSIKIQLAVFPSGVASADIFRKTSPKDSWKKIGNTKTPAYEDKTAKSLVSGKTYAYGVRYLDAKGKYISAVDNKGTRFQRIALPTVVATNSASEQTITWTKADGCVYYAIYTYDTDSKAYKLVAKVANTTTKYVNKKIEANTMYRYVVIPLDRYEKPLNLSYAKGVDCPHFNAPTLNTVANYSNFQSISWYSVPNIKNYRIYVKVNNGQWQKLRDVYNNTLRDENNNVSSGKTYTYCIVALDNNGKEASAKGNTKTLKFYSAPTIRSITPGSNGQTISWTSVSGVNNYLLYRKNANGSFSRIAFTNKTEWYATGVTNGTTYTYYVCCADGGGNALSSGSIQKSATFLNAPKVSSIESTKDGYLVKWNSISGASKYEVFCDPNYNANSSSHNWTSIAKVTGTSYTHTNVSNGKTYCYQIVSLDRNGQRASIQGYGMYGIYSKPQESSNPGGGSGAPGNIPYVTSGLTYDKAFHDKVVQKAYSYLNKDIQYVWGGDSPNQGSADCSGFVCSVYDQCGINIWGCRTTLRLAGSIIQQKDAQPGDIVLKLSDPNDITTGHHVGIYVGNGTMIDCNSGRGNRAVQLCTFWGNGFVYIRVK